MRLFGLMAVLLAIIYAPACALAAPPNTLTPQEIAEGWILLFDGETTYGWTTKGSDTWKVVDGALEAEGSGPRALESTTEFGDFELKAEIWSDKDGQGCMAFHAQPHRHSEDEFLNLIAGQLAKNKQKRETSHANRWRTIIVRREGRHVIIRDRDSRVNFPSEPDVRVNVWLTDMGKGKVRFRNVKLKPLGLKSIFNGKDLSGWTPIPDHKSVFSVTPEGWLNIKNGNGEIQTTGAWGDFVLQLDVYSNGDHLNSGVFFREEPGKFWLGYEDQIRNQWEGDDRNKAVDYGTGGIYNRLPARRVVSSDREWFTLTLVAHGNHIASWVNGFLVADFTDTRTPNEENARAGARTKAGVLGLQGHDPTTDLSFRNIRIVELPPVK